MYKRCFKHPSQTDLQQAYELGSQEQSKRDDGMGMRYEVDEIALTYWEPQLLSASKQVSRKVMVSVKSRGQFNSV